MKPDGEQVAAPAVGLSVGKAKDRRADASRPKVTRERAAYAIFSLSMWN